MSVTVVESMVTPVTASEVDMAIKVAKENVVAVTERKSDLEFK